jgi:hypothetical protein
MQLMNRLRKCGKYKYNGMLSRHKKNEIMLFVGKCVELENIMLSKVSQAQKVKGHMFSFICGS